MTTLATPRRKLRRVTIDDIASHVQLATGVYANSLRGWGRIQRIVVPRCLIAGLAREMCGASSTDIADSWQVVEKMRERGYAVRIIADNQAPMVYVSMLSPHDTAWVDPVDEKSAPRAICLAALKAVGVEVPSSP